MLSENLIAFDLKKRVWQRRTLEGVGWSPYLCAFVNDDGRRTDEMDQFIKRTVEDPAAPVLRAVAEHQPLSEGDRSKLAWFIAVTAARSPDALTGIIKNHVGQLCAEKRQELDVLAKLWCDKIGRPFNESARQEFVKPSSLGGMWSWAQCLQQRLLEWEWTFISTTIERPFVTSDHPVFAMHDSMFRARIVSCPLSSETAVLIIAGGRLNHLRDLSKQVEELNRQTIVRASRFIVARTESFPGADSLVQQLVCHRTDAPRR